MRTISLNGLDGSGKSQQLRLLQRRNEQTVNATKPLIAYSPRWPKLQGYEMSQWWFERISVEELTDIIIESLNNRQLDLVTDKLNVHDRGWRMFKAVCVATKLTRENIALSEALSNVEEQFAKKLNIQVLEEKEVLLEKDQNYFKKIECLTKLIRPEEAPDFPESAKVRYARYQRNLATVMDIYFHDPQCHRIAVCEPILNIQNKLRNLINEISGVKLPKLGEKIVLAVGFGGLSECGKSSFAEHLRVKHCFLRLKLRYFIDAIEGRGEKRTPETVAQELLEFLEYLPYMQSISFESLHDPYIPAMLKLMLGDRCQIVYIQTRDDVRVNRGARELGVNLDEASKVIAEKDRVKRGRGAEVVKEIADIVFDNSNDDYERNLQLFADRLLKK